MGEKGRWLVPFYRLLQLLKLELEILSLLVVGARDHVPLILVDRVEVYLPVIGTLQEINKRGKKKN